MDRSFYTYKPSNFEENSTYFDHYLKDLPKPFDDYFEMNLDQSTFYSLLYRDNHVGFFSIMEDKYLTSIYLPYPLLYTSSNFFQLIMNDFDLQMMLVTSFDELGLSLCVDNMDNIETHYLYYSPSGLIVRKAEHPFELFTKASLFDIDQIKEVAKDFIDSYEYRINANQVYMQKDDQGNILGLGLFVPHKYQAGFVSFGVYVAESTRNKSVGRSILLHLNKVAQEKNLIPRCASLPSNQIYNKTLLSAGFISDSKLFVGRKLNRK